MDLHLAGKTALVTASTGGIGQEIARSLAAEGATVIVNGRSEAAVAKALAEIGRTVPHAKLEGLAADNGTAAGTVETIRRFPDADIVVNNLGIYEAVGFFDETDADWLRLFEVNVLSGVRLSRHYLRRMLDRNWGRLFFISSESGLAPAPEMAHYSATKAMQLSISRALAELTLGTAVTVNAVLPGPTRTPGVEKFVDSLYPGVPWEEAEKKFFATNRPASLIQRFIQPSEIGDTVAFLSSPKAAATNGAAIRVEGGLIRHIA